MGLSAGTQLGPYEVLGPLGSGGMGEVYRARDTRLGRQVAVKILPDAVSQDPRRVALFETEARSLAALSHPNVLAIHDVGRVDGRLYAVTELLDGETLRNRMADEALSWRKAAEIAASIADGLASAHAAGIVHRDLKPENVFLTSDGRLKILDFGLATYAEPVLDDAVTLTSPSGGTLSGEVVGTLSYMAPEQLRGRRVDGRTDIFALGCVLYEMLAGKRPFTGATPADTLAAILHHDPEPFAPGGPGIPPGLQTIVFRCLEKRPEDRYDTAHDLAIALRSISAEQAAVRSGESPRPSPPRRGTRLVALGIGAAIVVASLLLIGTLSRPSPAGSPQAGSWGLPKQITSTAGWDGEPAISPDGTLVAYSSNASGKLEIWVVDPEGGEPLQLTDSAAENRNPAWFPDGRALAFVSTQGGSSSVRKVSRLGGSTSLIIEEAETPAISPDGTHVAFSRITEGGLHRIWVAPIGDSSRAERLTGDDDGPWEHMNPAWSPDGSKLCYAAFQDIWSVPAAGGKPLRLTQNGIPGAEPVFSPGGDYVYFGSRRGLPSSIWRVSATGGVPERVMSGTGAAGHPSLSGDGRRLVFASSVRDMDVVLIDLQKGSMSRIKTSKDDETPTLAPDGSAVAFVSNRLGPWDLWIEDVREGRVGNGPARRLTAFERGMATPAFSPDGRWIAFFRPMTGHREVWALPLDGSAAIPLVRSDADNLHPAYAPDMSRLVFVSDRSGRLNLWMVALAGGRPLGEPFPVTKGSGTDAFPVWSPDGVRIAFLRGTDIWLVDARPGSEAIALTHGAGIQAVAFEPGGSAVIAPGLFRTPTLHLRRVSLATGTSEILKPSLPLGDRNAMGSVSLSRDGRLVATDITELRGNIWMTTAVRNGR